MLCIILSGTCPFIIDHNSRKWGITKQLLSGFLGNRWSVGPSDELLPSAFGLWQQFIFRANRSSVALKPSQQLYNVNKIFAFLEHHAWGIVSQGKLQLPVVFIHLTEFETPHLDCLSSWLQPTSPQHHVVVPVGQPDVPSELSSVI